MIFVDCTKKTMMCIDDKENHLWWCPSHIGLQLQRLVHAQFPHLPARSFPRLPLHFAPHPARQQVSLRSLTWCLEGPSWLVGRDAYTILNIYIYTPVYPTVEGFTLHQPSFGVTRSYTFPTRNGCVREKSLHFWDLGTSNPAIILANLPVNAVPPKRPWGLVTSRPAMAIRSK